MWEGGGGGGSLSQSREIKKKTSCKKTAFSYTLNSIIGGRLCEVAYTNPLLPLFDLLQSTGRGALVSLAMPVTMVQPGSINGRGGGRVGKRGRFLKIRA